MQHGGRCHLPCINWWGAWASRRMQAGRQGLGPETRRVSRYMHMRVWATPAAAQQAIAAKRNSAWCKGHACSTTAAPLWTAAPMPPLLPSVASCSRAPPTSTPVLLL